ncbi:MAG: formylglycine-generating enzyme family protein, partial [Verrucomicrobiae bacterium]|nr:formylglycine-generating enzyme family protein [Verrucomicrobiae bacterium]
IRRWTGTALLAGGLGCVSGCHRAPANTGTDAPPPTPAPAVTLVPLTNMVHIPAGGFTRLKQELTLTRDFWLSRFEVTQREYSALTGGNPSHFTGDDQRPVEKVSNEEAAAYCAALTKRERAAGHLAPGYVYRLPTEAEWEYACRAGSTNHFSFGDQESAAAAYAWTQENSEMTSHPVGLKQPNAWGLYDMHGNVWEWCADWFADYAGDAVTDPVGPPNGKFKVFRGGGWNNEVKFARCSNRFMMEPSNGIHFVGFRVALGRELPKPPPPPVSTPTNQPPAATP